MAGDGEAVSDAPQPSQNFAPARFRAPQEAHSGETAEPQWSQNRAAGRFSTPHFGQRIVYHPKLVLLSLFVIPTEAGSRAACGAHEIVFAAQFICGHPVAVPQTADSESL